MALLPFNNGGVTPEYAKLALSGLLREGHLQREEGDGSAVDQSSWKLEEGS
jgi:hypothetical protein